MKKHIFDSLGENLLRVEDAEPECGQDFCDSCGDCLACYEGECLDSEDGQHYWVEYEEASLPTPTLGREGE